jgi:hypothetical protein
MEGRADRGRERRGDGIDGDDVRLHRVEDGRG